jgi:hypothetical protein
VKLKVEAYMNKHRFTIIDFANIGHMAFGCVAAGNEFVHINAHGDLEPCAFFHYSDENINDKPLAVALESNFFRHFRKTKPFSENPHRPCPIMDVPEVLQHLSEAKGVHSTHLHSTESLQQLAEKTKSIASGWKPVADELLLNMPEKEERKIKLFRRHLLYREK